MSRLNQPAVAVVILNYNGRHYLERFLPSVLASTYAHKRVIVADNGSVDDSVHWLRQQPGVELLVLERNHGFAQGYNLALQQVQSDYYVLLNSDVEVSPGWIEPVVALLEANDRHAVCQPLLRDHAQPQRFEYAGAAGGWIDYLGYPFARGRLFNLLEKDTRQYADAVPVFWASGAAMFIRAPVYHAVGGLDAWFFAHQEEIDLCWRVQLAGYRVLCCPASVVYHVGGGTLPRGHRKTFLNFRNNLVMLLKNLPFRESCWKLPVRILLDLLFAAKCLLTGDAAGCKAILQAHAAVLRWCLNKAARKAYRPLAKAPMHTLDGVYRRSLVWAWYVRGKKKFSDLFPAKPVQYPK